MGSICSIGRPPACCVTAYLIAIKSLYQRIGQGRVLIIDDGSLTAEDISILKHHIPGIGVLDIASIDTGTRRGRSRVLPCPA